MLFNGRGTAVSEGTPCTVDGREGGGRKRLALHPPRKSLKQDSLEIPVQSLTCKTRSLVVWGRLRLRNEERITRNTYFGPSGMSSKRGRDDGKVGVREG